MIWQSAPSPRPSRASWLPKWRPSFARTACASTSNAHASSPPTSPPPRTLEERVFLRFVESYENLPERIATRGLIELLCETLWEDGVERAEPLRPCGTFNRSVFTSDYVLDLVCEMHRGSDRATEGLHPVLQGMQFEITLQNHRPLPALNACVGFLLRAMYFRASNYPALEYLAFCEAVQRCREGTYDSGRFPRPILPDHDRIRSGAPGYDCTGDQEFILSVCEIELDRLERCMHSLVFHESVFEQALSTARELSGRQRSLLLDMIVNPYEETSIKDYRKRFSVAYSTGHDDLADLADRGYLVRIDQKRALTYLPGPRLAEVARKAIEGRNGNRSEELCSNGEVRP